jgi:hypothetical protein
MGLTESKKNILIKSIEINVHGCLEMYIRSKATKGTPVELSIKKTSFLDMPRASINNDEVDQKLPVGLEKP